MLDRPELNGSTRRRVPMVLAAAFALAALLSACEQKNKTEGAAEESANPNPTAQATATPAQTAAAAEKVVNIYNWSDYIGETTLADFKAATGITANYDVYDSNEVLEGKLLAGNSGYDVVVPTSQPYFAKQIKTGVYQKLDKSKIPNLKNLDPELMTRVASADPGNTYGVIYQWGTSGLGFNVKKIKERMPDAPLDSFDILLKPEVVAKFADCGVTMLDSSSDIIPIALNYLGKDPNSESQDDLAAAESLLLKIRPYVRYFHSSQYINDLANGDICLALGFSGDILQAKARAEEAKNGVEIGYAIPKEGTLLWFDMMAIPADAPHPEAAYAYINFVLEPKVMAGITNFVAYANAVPASLADVVDEIKNDPTVFPSPEVKERLFTTKTTSSPGERQRNRSWTRVKSGQ